MDGVHSERLCVSVVHRVRRILERCRRRRATTFTGCAAPAPSALATRTFVATFGHLFTDDDLLPYLRAAYDVDHVRAEIEDPQRYVLLVFAQDAPATPCGYGMLHDGNPRPGDDERADPQDYLELKRLYVDAVYHGKGAARVLMDDMMAVIRAKNRKVTWIGAWYQSFRAHQFYKKYGFVQTGTRVFPVGKTENPSFVFTLLREEKEVAASSSSSEPTAVTA